MQKGRWSLKTEMRLIVAENTETYLGVFKNEEASTVAPSNAYNVTSPEEGAAEEVVRLHGLRAQSGAVPGATAEQSGCCLSCLQESRTLSPKPQKPAFQARLNRLLVHFVRKQKGARKKINKKPKP